MDTRGSKMINCIETMVQLLNGQMDMKNGFSMDSYTGTMVLLLYGPMAFQCGGIIMIYYIDLTDRLLSVQMELRNGGFMESKSMNLLFGYQVVQRSVYDTYN